MKKTTIELTTKEAYLLWQIASWFIKPNWHISHTLMAKLYDAIEDDERQRFRMKYEDTELNRIADVAKWLEETHPELLKD